MREIPVSGGNVTPGVVRVGDAVREAFRPLASAGLLSAAGLIGAYHAAVTDFELPGDAA